MMGLQSKFKKIASARDVYEASLVRTAEMIDVEAVVAAMTENDEPDSSFEAWTGIYNPATFLNIQDNFRVAMRQVPLSMSQEANLLFEQSNMSAQTRSDIASAFQSKARSARDSVAMQNWAVETVLPKLAAVMAKNTLWRQMQDTARTLKTGTVDITNPPDLTPAIKHFPGLTRSGFSAVRQQDFAGSSFGSVGGTKTNATIGKKGRKESRGRGVLDDIPDPENFGLMYLSEQGVDLYQPDNVGMGAWFALGFGGNYFDSYEGMEQAILVAVNGRYPDGWYVQAHSEYAAKALCASGKNKLGGWTIIFMAQQKGANPGKVPKPLKARYSQFNGLGFQTKGNIDGDLKLKLRMFFPYQVPVKGLGSEWFFAVRPMIGIAPGPTTVWWSAQWAVAPYGGPAWPQVRLHINVDVSDCDP